jgi:4-hydroxy-2-oxoglutarate aldolase
MANSFPELVVELWHYGQARDEARGLPLQERVTKINKAISGKYGVSGVKAAMNLAGYRGGIPRRPLLRLTAGQRRTPHGSQGRRPAPIRNTPGRVLGC